ncbi:MAG: hypothetical protein MUC38_13530 [Cyclobacteriaceae bacterium]|jgi:hypothetical protein|nr:hypothetical protein [Cyclobacteriaceae bacterium]
MRILFDENIPRALVRNFPDHEVKTLQALGWAGKKNGELLGLISKTVFDVFVTADKNLPYPQNHDNLTMAVLILNVPWLNYPTVRALAPKIQERLSRPIAAGI